jgi:Transposase DDE domain
MKTEGTESINTSLLEQIINSINDIIDNKDFVNRHKDRASSFTRHRVFNFKVLLCFLMTNLQKGLQREIALFSEAIALQGGSIPEVDKSAFCKARKKLNPTAFIQLSAVVAEQFYSAPGSAQYWKGFRLIGVDGTTIVVPNSKEIQQQFGVFKYRSDGKAICMARSLMIYDTLNHLTLHASMDSMEESEISMLWKCLPSMELQQNDLLIFDRYFASHLLFFYLHQRRVQFCFRMKNNWWKVVERFYNSGAGSEVVNLELPSKHKAKAAQLGITQTKLLCRLVRVELEGTETEIVLTSLLEEAQFSIADIKELYGWRWPVEEAYKLFKHKVCIENFSGTSLKAVQQDFYVKIFIMNLTAAAIQPINKALEKETVKVKYKHQVNITEAIFSLKKAVVSFFVLGKITVAIQKFCKRIAKITEPIRLGRNHKRNHQPKQKHYMNCKPV